MANRKLTYHENKTLKLTNVLKYPVSHEQENQEMHVIIEQMQSYIRIKGAMQIGPLIQFTKAELTESGEMQIEMALMLQCNTYIHGVSAPYTMDAVLRVPHAAYCRYQGPESMLQFAYQKIYLEAFEHDIELGSESYTIFVGQDEDAETIMADVFIPKKGQ